MKNLSHLTTGLLAVSMLPLSLPAQIVVSFDDPSVMNHFDYFGNGGDMTVVSGVGLNGSSAYQFGSSNNQTMQIYNQASFDPTPDAGTLETGIYFQYATPTSTATTVQYPFSIAVVGDKVAGGPTANEWPKWTLTRTDVTGGNWYGIRTSLTTPASPNANSGEISLRIGWINDGTGGGSSGPTKNTAFTDGGANPAPLVDGNWYYMNLLWSYNSGTGAFTATTNLYNSDSAGVLLGSPILTTTDTRSGISATTLLGNDNEAFIAIGHQVTTGATGTASHGFPRVDNLIVPVPEPATLTVVLAACIGLLAWRRRNLR